MEKTKRLIASILTGSMLFAGAIPAFADDGGDTAGSSGSGAADIISSLSNISYSDYLERYADMPAGRGDITLDGKDYDAGSTTASVSLKSGIYGESDEVLLVPVDGIVSWKFDVPSAGMYNMTIEYAAVTKEGRDGSDTSVAQNIERVFYLNGSVPFEESRLIAMRKSWAFVYTENENGELRFEQDSGGNELRPQSKFVGKWESLTVFDDDTYFSDPFIYYLREGENTVSFEGIREDLYIRKIIFSKAEPLESYENVLNGYSGRGYAAADADAIYINAETPSEVSSSTITPGYDRSSAATEPQSATAIKRNVIGGSSWSNTGDWVKYKFDVKTAGLYNIVLRYKQDSIPGGFVSRALKIDGEYPFSEARECRFDYSQSWQVVPLGNGDYEFQFYLEPGEHELEFMATVGQFGEVLTQVNKLADRMNNVYLEIVKLTGSYPDENRDYGFSRVLPDAIREISACAEDIDSIIEYIGEMIGNTSGSRSQNTAELEGAALTLREMSRSERNIAANLWSMNTDVSNLAGWCADLESQPLQIDYILVQPVGSAMPKVEAGLIENIKYELGQFFGSFYTDYNSFADKDDQSEDESESLEVWMSSGRDRATIIRDLVNSGFCEQTGINVSLKLVDAGALLPSILAGIGPDLALDNASTIDYALRGAVLPLNDMEGYDDIMKRFYPSAITPLALYDKVYGLPVTLDFPMMFVRNDILSNLGLEVPKTWDEFLALIPVLQYNNMTVILPGGDYKMFLYQMGGDVWDQTSDNISEHGWRTSFDTNKTLTAFSKMCEMFTQYSLYVQLNVQTNFKTGSVPVAIASYTTYTSLTVFAPEIAGLWQMYPIPGTVQDDGSVDNTAVVTVTGLSMLKGSDKENTWKFMCWYTDVDFQVDLCNEMISLLGPAAKTTTANIAAMAEMPWSAAEYSNLMAQYEHTVGVPSYPGAYVIDRYANMAFQAAYNDGENPAEALRQYVNAANQEITRKRTEFNMPTYSADANNGVE